jgi:asparagine synthase (glutamine-hydrolysing)
MSGICAVWRSDYSEEAGVALGHISRGLSLAADDRIARESEPGIGVGLCARFGTQQIYRNARLLLVCDADLHNEKELAALAGHTGEAPASAKTAALLAALYERCGNRFVEKLRGAFSLILWDHHDRRMLAAVDPFGIHRLVYFQDSYRLLIASRIDALMQSGEIQRNVNPRVIANVLNFSVNLGPETIFNQVQRIPPGSILVASGGRTSLEKYWDMRYGVGRDTNEDRLSRELEARVENSVAAHCKDESFEHTGAFLSGGTDSSTVVGMMTRMGRGPVMAFSIGFQEEVFNELEYARIAARKFQADHHTYLVSAADCLEALPHMIRQFDEPFGNSSAIPTYFCARLASQNGVRVLLGGDGGDELFGGNEGYRTEKVFDFYQNVPAVLRNALIEPVLKALPLRNGPVEKARRYVRRAKIPRVERMLSYHFLCAHAFEEVFEADFLKELDGYSVYDRLGRYLAEAPARDALDQRLYADVKTVLGDSDLPKVTCMSELAGIQARFPFLDRSVAEFSGCIPAGLKVKGLEKRYLFKRAFRNLLPVEILEKKKHGFGIPVSVWMKSDPGMRELLHDTMFSARSFDRGYFRREFLEQLFRNYEADDTSYFGDTLWTFLVLELWHREFVDQPVTVNV